MVESIIIIIIIVSNNCFREALIHYMVILEAVICGAVKLYCVCDRCFY